MTLNFIAIALAIIGTLNPIVGALVHNAGSVLVITNSAFLLNWRKKIMVIKIIGLIIGILVLGAGVYYLAKEKHDPESRKIYTVVSVVGGVIAAACAVLLFV